MAISLIQSAPIKDRIPSATLNVKQLIEIGQVVMVHKILNGQCPGTLKQKFKRISQISNKEGE